MPLREAPVWIEPDERGRKRVLPRIADRSHGLARFAAIGERADLVRDVEVERVLGAVANRRQSTAEPRQAGIQIELHRGFEA
jgi:hypothetical protein